MFVLKTTIHLRVVDTNRSAAFYEALLGAAPSVRGANITVFELDSPPLLLTLEEHPGGRRGKSQPSGGAHPTRRSRRSRAGFALLVGEPRDLGTAAIALRRAGIALRLEDRAIEAQDPDGNPWRVRFVPSTRDRTIVEATWSAP